MAKRCKAPGTEAMRDIDKAQAKPQGPAKRRGEQRIAGATGASDATSGGGAGSGIPDAGMQMRTRGAAGRGNVKRDRERLFPETKRRARKAGSGKTGPGRGRPGK